MNGSDDKLFCLRSLDIEPPAILLLSHYCYCRQSGCQRCGSYSCRASEVGSSSLSSQSRNYESNMVVSEYYSK